MNDAPPLILQMRRRGFLDVEGAESQAVFISKGTYKLGSEGVKGATGKPP